MKLRIANPPKAEMDKFLHGVVGAVEANSYESLCLWHEQHERAGKTWKQGSGGCMVQVGELADMPVCVSLFVNEVDGHRILFYDATSRVVDSRMVEKWLKENLPLTAFENGDARKRLNVTNAMNFHNVLPRERRAA
jgi:hypothetical protein